ncbi:MAG: hypothetical protein JXR48_10325 [Candidatus Delongbacteria bacterium]|nr:hypothetical protein [Candidatus Delongbacteria bacterium]MBN2835351.1 hypothetical protein [Candidatus Delongbacteria bacterium]
MRLFLSLILIIFIFSCSLNNNFRSYNLKDKEIKSNLIKKNRFVQKYTGSFNFFFTDRSGKRQSSGELIIGDDTDFLLTIKGLVGETEVLVLSTKGNVYIENYYENVYYVTEFNDKILSELTGYDISYKEFKDILTGFKFISKEQFEIVNIDTSSISVASDSNVYTFDTFLNLTEITRSENERVVIDYYSKIEDFAFPRRIRYFNDELFSKLTIFFSSIELDKSPFQLPELEKLEVINE